MVDLTRSSLNSLGDHWPKALARLLAALETLGKARPPIIALTEDVLVMRRADGVIRESSQLAKAHRAFPHQKGVFLALPGFIGDATENTGELSAIKFRADIKDRTLLRLRDDVLKCARELAGRGDEQGAAAVRGGLSYVRSVATLPLGLGAAKEVVEVLYGTSDEGDMRVRQRFYPADALLPIVECARVSTNSDVLREFRTRFLDLVSGWEAATPVSVKLKGMLIASDPAISTMLVLPDRHVANVFAVSDLGVACPWRISEPGTMVDVAKTYQCRRWVIVRPTSQTLKVLLMANPGPEQVDVIGDAAGTAMLEMDLRPMTTMDAFLPVKQRALALLKEIGKVATSVEADRDEVNFKFASRKVELDFTQSGGAYVGDKIRITTEQGYTLLYRKGGEVLRHTPSDLRAFEKVEARHLEQDDAVLVLTSSLMELLRERLERAPKTIGTLRSYHKAVAKRREALPGSNLSEKARGLIAVIQKHDPSFSSDELQNVKRWLDVEETTLDDPHAPPQAPRTKARFSAFTRGLEVPPATADLWWDEGVRLTRSYRLSEGMLFSQRAVNFVLDPESYAARDGTGDVGLLQKAILDNVDVVTRLENLNA